MKNKILVVLRVCYKVLPYIIGVLGGSAAVAAVSGCKCGSIISLAAPAL